MNYTGSFYITALVKCWSAVAKIRTRTLTTSSSDKRKNFTIFSKQCTELL